MIPGTGWITSGLLLLSITAELFSQKLPDQVMRLPLCFHSIQVSFDWPRSTNKRAPRSWHQLSASQSQHSQNSPFTLAHCRANRTRTYKKLLFGTVSAPPPSHTVLCKQAPRISMEFGYNRRLQTGNWEMVHAQTHGHMSGNNAKYGFLLCIAYRQPCWTWIDWVFRMWAICSGSAAQLLTPPRKRLRLRSREN